MGTHTVTFQVTPGLQYSVDSNSGGRVVFTASVAEGFVFEGSLRVTSNAGTLTHVEGIYTLSGIATDIVVTIDGDVDPVSGPEDPTDPEVPADDPSSGDSFPWWILIVVIAVAVVAILADTIWDVFDV